MAKNTTRLDAYLRKLERDGSSMAIDKKATEELCGQVRALVEKTTEGV